jgi:hypothetical protein
MCTLRLLYPVTLSLQFQPGKKQKTGACTGSGLCHGHVATLTQHPVTVARTRNGTDRSRRCYQASPASHTISNLSFHCFFASGLIAHAMLLSVLHRSKLIWQGSHLPKLFNRSVNQSLPARCFVRRSTRVSGNNVVLCLQACPLRQTLTGNYWLLPAACSHCQ